jgi:hypothetical protein
LSRSFRFANEFVVVVVFEDFHFQMVREFMWVERERERERERELTEN